MKIIINGEVVEIPGGSSTTPSDSGLPINSVILWAGTADTVPEGWHICDGTEGTIDLRGLFVLGAGGKYSVGDTGGSEEVELTEAQIPKHNHNYSAPNNTATMKANSTTSGAYTLYIGATNRLTANTGSSLPHSNMPPYYALYYIQKVSE